MNNEAAFDYYSARCDIDILGLVESFFDYGATRALCEKILNHSGKIPMLYARQIMDFIEEKGRGYFLKMTVQEKQKSICQKCQFFKEITRPELPSLDDSYCTKNCGFIFSSGNTFVFDCEKQK